MDLEGIMLIGIRQRNTIWSYLYVELKKKKKQYKKLSKVTPTVAADPG